MIDPTNAYEEDPVARICEDFDGPIGGESGFKPLYGQVHIFFVSSVTDSVLEKLSKSSIYDRVRTCSELNLAYTPIDTHAFTLSHQFSNESLTKFYGSEAEARGKLTYFPVSFCCLC